MNISTSSRSLLLVLCSFLFGVTAANAQDEPQNEMEFTTFRPPSSGRTWQTSDVRADFNAETGQMVVTGYFESSNPQPDNETQEMTLILNDFNGEGSYDVDGSNAVWEDRNSGTGVCEESVLSEVKVTSFNTAEAVGFVGEFTFRCTSRAKNDVVFETRINGSFKVDVRASVEAPEGENGTVMPETEVELTWKAPIREKIDLFVVYENPEQYEPERYEIATQVDAAGESITWTVPDTMSPQAWIVLVDPLNPDVPVVSEEFRIRGYRLAKLAYDAGGSCPECPYYLEFTPKKHGFSVVNGDAQILDPAGRSDSRRFDYATATDPITGEGYPKFFTRRPISATKHDYSTWPSFVAAFGENRTYGTDRSGDIVPIDRAVRIWAGWASDYEGSCYGLSAMAGLMFIDPEGTLAQFPTIGSLSSAKNPFSISLENPLVDDIDLLFSMQYSTVNQNGFRFGRGQGPSYSLERLKEYLLNDDAEDLQRGSNLVGIWNDGPRGGGHALTAYKVEEDEEAGTAKIFVYDSNHPGSENRAISINTETDSWSYDIAGGWSGTAYNLALSMSYNQYSRSLIPFERSSASTSTAMVSAATTTRIGMFEYVPGEGVTSPTEGVLPLYRMTGQGEPAGYDMDGGISSIDITVTAAGDGLSALLFAPGISLDFFSDATANESARLSWDDEGVTATNTNGEQTINLDALFEQEGVGRTLGVRELALNAGDSVRLEISEEEETVELVNYGPATQYEILVRTTGKNGFGEGAYRPVDIASGERHRLSPRWDSIADDLRIDVVTDAGGRDSIFLDNLLTSVGSEESTVSSLTVENPVGDRTAIGLGLRRPAAVAIVLTDMRGVDVARLYEGMHPGGERSIPVDLSDIDAGAYVLSVVVDGERVTSTIVTKSR